MSQSYAGQMKKAPGNTLNGTWFVLLAAGQGTRMAKAAGCPKQFLSVEGVPLYWLSVRKAAHIARISGLVLVFPKKVFAECRKQAEELLAKEDIALPVRFAQGGERRQDSVANGLSLVPDTAAHVLVHDAARPFFTQDLAERLIDSLEAGHCAVIPGIKVTDTIKKADEEGFVLETPPRAMLRAVQTPQGFSFKDLKKAHAGNQAAGNADVTDDAALMEACGHPVLIIEGEQGNGKLTNPEDLSWLKDRGEETMPQDHFAEGSLVPCTGFGYDVHRYGGTRPLILAATPIPSEYTIEAHSDGDVALHALMDALLSLIGAGDIGMLFPDTDPAFDGADSALLLKEVLKRTAEAKVRLTHVDVTIVAQKPKIGPYKEAMRQKLCELLALPPIHVNVKATTEEKLGFTGALQGIKAYAAVTALCRA